jgi:hypothetical protein
VTPLQLGEEVAKTMRNLDKALTTATKAALREAGNTAKDELNKSGRRQLPGLRLRNMRGAKLGIKTRVTEDNVSVSPSGPWGILEPGADPHSIGSSGQRLRIGNRVVRGPVRHPGTRNTNAWSNGQEATFRAVSEDFPRSVGDALEEAFDG